jgi:hypothetical protein
MSKIADWPPGHYEPHRSIDPPIGLTKSIEELRLELVKKNYELYIWQHQQEYKRLCAWLVYHEENKNLEDKDMVEGLIRQAQSRLYWNG